MNIVGLVAFKSGGRIYSNTVSATQRDATAKAGAQALEKTKSKQTVGHRGPSKQDINQVPTGGIRSLSTFE
jgi:hypothetical protein